MELSKRLAELRKSRKLSLRAVSSRCKCPFRYLHNLEKDKIRRPKIDLLYKLAVFYGFSSDILIIEARKIPQDVYWRIVDNPELLQVIRNYKLQGKSACPTISSI